MTNHPRAHSRVSASRLGAVAIAAAMSMSLAAAAPVSAADVSPPELVDVTLSTSAVSVAGLAVKTVTISVHLTDDVGVGTIGEDFPYTPWPHVGFARTDGAGDIRGLTLTSGTPQDGIWVGELLVPSTYDGTWRVSSVAARDTSENQLFVDPSSMGIDRRLEVTGTHQPRLSLGFTPDPATIDQRITGKGRLTWADTGAPIPRRPLIVGMDTNCGVDGWGGDRVVTNDNGYFRYDLPVVPGLFIYSCIFLISPLPSGDPADQSFDYYRVAHIAARAGGPQLRPLIGARPNRLVVPAGGTVRIDGRVRPALPFVRIYLQRWTAHGWRVETFAVIRESGRYTLIAHPPRRGTFRYRVIRPPLRGGGVATGVSRVLILTGT